MWKNSAVRYGIVAKSLHWAVAVLIALQIILAEIAEDLPLGLEKLAIVSRHKSFGMTVLALVLLRLTWRLINPPPPLPQMRAYESVLAKMTHWGFYVLLVALPISGWLMSSAANFSVSYFGLFTFPDLIEPDKETVEQLKDLHELIGKLLMATIVLHAAAALKHHFVDRDDVLRRMLPGARTRDSNEA